MADAKLKSAKPEKCDDWPSQLKFAAEIWEKLPSLGDAKFDLWDSLAAKPDSLALNIVSDNNNNSNNNMITTTPPTTTSTTTTATSVSPTTSAPTTTTSLSTTTTVVSATTSQCADSCVD